MLTIPGFGIEESDRYWRDPVIPGLRDPGIEIPIRHSNGFCVFVSEIWVYMGPRFWVWIRIVPTFLCGCVPSP